MSSEIVLSKGIRTNLLTLQDHASNLDVTQNRLATGKKVNSALDNALSYFVAQGFNQKAGDLRALQDNIGLGINVIKQADNGITNIQRLVDTAKGLLRQAQSTTDLTTRAALSVQYNNLLPQITSLAADANFNGVNLLYGSGGSGAVVAGTDQLKVQFNETNTTNIVIPTVFTGAGSSTVVLGPPVVSTIVTGIGLNAPTGSWATSSDLDQAATQLDNATLKLRAQASSLGANLTVLQTRQDFIKKSILSLQDGNDLLVLADQNEEGAKLLALQTRQQLSTQALSLANKSDEAILRLFA
jgi:flagellin